MQTLISIGCPSCCWAIADMPMMRTRGWYPRQVGRERDAAAALAHVPAVGADLDDGRGAEGLVHGPAPLARPAPDLDPDLCEGRSRVVDGAALSAVKRGRDRRHDSYRSRAHPGRTTGEPHAEACRRQRVQLPGSVRGSLPV
jgi:hypothetical protein